MEGWVREADRRRARVREADRWKVRDLVNAIDKFLP